MKNVILSLILSLCSFNLFAEVSDQPIGFAKMLTTLSQVENPRDALGQTFLLTTPAGKEKNVLHILPEDAAETIALGKGSYRVRILDAAPFYDMSFYNDTGSISLNEVKYSWENGAIATPDVSAGQECVNILNFQINGNEFTKENLNKYKVSNTPYKFIFNPAVLRQSKDNEFSFTRLTNDPAIVTLMLYKKDGSVFTKIESKQVAVCSAIQSKTETFKWDSWSEFNTCSKTCGGGTQSRTRTCLTEDTISCIGNAFEEKSCNQQACEVKPMTEEQKKQLKMNGVSLNIISASNLSILRPKGTANYEASLSNPFSRTISCDVSITSSRGYNTDYQTIDRKAHVALVVQANGVTKVSGTINIMRGHDDTGMSWADANYRGNTYFAENCRFLN